MTKRGKGGPGEKNFLGEKKGKKKKKKKKGFRGFIYCTCSFLNLGLKIISNAQKNSLKNHLAFLAWVKKKFHI